MGDQVHRDALARGRVRTCWSWKNDGRARSSPVADRGQQRHAPLQQDEPGAGAGGHDRRGQVDEFAVFAPGPGGDDDDPAGPQQGVAAAQDVGEPVDEAGQVAVGEVAVVVRRSGCRT